MGPMPIGEGKIMSALTTEQRQALELAKAHFGRTWKSKLGLAWMNGRESDIADSVYYSGATLPFSRNDLAAYLRQVRNRHGSAALKLI